MLQQTSCCGPGLSEDFSSISKNRFGASLSLGDHFLAIQQNGNHKNANHANCLVRCFICQIDGLTIGFWVYSQNAIHILFVEVDGREGLNAQSRSWLRYEATSLEPVSPSKVASCESPCATNINMASLLSSFVRIMFSETVFQDTKDPSDTFGQDI